MPAIDQSDVDPDLANTVKLESALTDVFCVVGAMTLVGLQGSNAIDRGEVITTLVASFGMGLGIGVIGGVMWLVLGRLWDTTRHRYPMTLASLMVLYVITERMGGSAALGVWLPPSHWATHRCLRNVCDFRKEPASIGR